jgi:hypothetical protein
MKTRRWLTLAVLSISFGFAPTLAALTPTSMTVPIAGVVFGLPESVLLSGTAQINVRPALADLPAAQNRAVISIDLSDVTGRGMSTGATYVAGTQINLTRQLVGADTIRVTIPFSLAGSAATAVTRTAVATFQFKYDVLTGALTSATASFVAPALTNGP